MVNPTDKSIHIKKELFFFLHQQSFFFVQINQSITQQQPSRSFPGPQQQVEPQKSDPVFSDLKSGVGIDQELLEESLEPSTSLRSRGDGIGQTAMEIVTGRSSVGSTIRFTTGYIKRSC